MNNLNTILDQLENQTKAEISEEKVTKIAITTEKGPVCAIFPELKTAEFFKPYEQLAPTSPELKPLITYLMSEDYTTNLR